MNLEEEQKTMELLRQQKNELSVKESTSLALDLETLKIEYNNLLTRYKQATLDYTANLNAEADPCSEYSENNTDVSQACYDKIWKSAGCTTTDFTKSNMGWARSQTLRNLIYDSFLWATTTDERHRIGCYGTYGPEQPPYIIVGCGTDGYLYKRDGLNGIWTQVSDSGSAIKGVSLGKDGKTIYCINTSNQVFSKPTLDTQQWTGPLDVNNGFLTSIGQINFGNGNYDDYSIGLDNKIWTKNKSSTSWTPNYIATYTSKGYFIMALGNSLRTGYFNTSNDSWAHNFNLTSSIMNNALTPDNKLIFVGDDYNLYSGPNLTDVENASNQGSNLPTITCTLINNSGSVTSITIIPIPKYEGSGTQTHYSTAIEPNYNISAPKYSTIKGQSFWGTTPISQTIGKTLNECMASVASTPGATGATFNKDNVCFLRGGDGTTIPSSENDFAIVPKSKQLLQAVESISTELINKNAKMQEKIEKTRKVYGDQISMRDIQHYDLIAEHEKLQKDRKIIRDELNQYHKLELEEAENGLFATQNYYGFFLLFMLVFIFIIILAFSSTDQNTTNVITDLINNVFQTIILSFKFITTIINPNYILFVIILVFTISYIYNQYFQNVYNNLPSFKTLTSESNILYLVIFIVLVFIIGSIVFTKSY